MDQTNALAKLVDTNAKITRSELIDLVMEEMSNELEKELEASEERLNELNEKHFSYDDVKSYLSKVRFHIDVDTYAARHKDRANHSLRFCENVPSISAKDAQFGEHIKEVLELDAKVSNLRQQKYQMENKKRAFKATITKKILEGTKEGRSLLDQLTNLKTHVRKQLGIG